MMNDPRKVLLLASSADRYGSDRAALDLASDLQDMGDEVVIAVPEPGPLCDIAKQRGIQTVVMPLTVLRRRSLWEWLTLGSRLSWNLARVFILARRLRPDVVHSNTSHVLDGAFLSVALRRPHAWHFREIHDDVPRISTVLTLIAAVGSKRLVCISNAVAAAHLSTTPRRVRNFVERRVQVISDGISPAEFAVDRVAGRNASPMRILAYGRMARWKGYDVLIQACHTVAGLGESLHLSLAGGAVTPDDRAYLGELRAQASELDVMVDFVGVSDDVPGLLSRADAVVLPSRTPEPFGRVVLEAMASGAPVVATSPGGPSEVITDGEDGLLVPCGDAPALAEALVRLARDPDERQRLGAAGKITVERSFSTMHTSAAVRQMHRDICS